MDYRASFLFSFQSLFLLSLSRATYLLLRPECYTSPIEYFITAVFDSEQCFLCFQTWARNGNQLFASWHRFRVLTKTFSKTFLWSLETVWWWQRKWNVRKLHLKSLYVSVTHFFRVLCLFGSWYPRAVIWFLGHIGLWYSWEALHKEKCS